MIFTTRRFHGLICLALLLACTFSSTGKAQAQINLPLDPKIASHLDAETTRRLNLAMSALPDSSEVIRSFDSVVHLQKDTSLDVSETIVYDFKNMSKHGIFRDIPVVYTRNGGTYSLYWKVRGVTDEKGQSLNYETSRRGDDLEIKIGDKGTLIMGVHTYKIEYSMRRAVNFFDGKPEVYWNATGNQWIVPIQSATCRFYAPPGVATNQIRTSSFVGAYGSKTPAQVVVQNDSILYSASNLAAGQGLTIVAGLPAGSVVAPSSLQNLLWFLADWWPLIAFPLATAFYLLTKWRSSGRDIDGGQAIGVEWNPPKDLSPAEVGTLIDERCDMQDIVSTLVDLAARGYLRITETKQEKLLFLSSTDYIFTKLQPFSTILSPIQRGPDVLSTHEKLFLTGLFGGAEEVTLSSLKQKFYVFLPGIKKAIYQSVTDKKLFSSNPETVRASYVGIGVLLTIGGVVGSIAGVASGHAAYGLGLLISGLLLCVFARAMPAKTAFGSRQLRECQGFQRFVKLAEKDRIAVLAKEDPTIFGRLLPYAMVLGVADQWAYAFKDLMTEPPDWYVPYGYGYGSGFNSMGFVHNLGGGMNTMGSTFSSAPSSTAGSGGSGFSSGGGSGGGFGGGGGGSW